jgi:hypothetical protein
MIQKTNPIADPEKLHCGKKLYAVLSVKNEKAAKDDNLAKYVNVDTLKHAKLRTLVIHNIGYNESQTAMIVNGLLVNKDGKPAFDVKEAKKNLVENLEIPLDQENTPLQPGTWMESMKDAQSMAKDINSKANDAIKHIRSELAKIEAFNQELIDKGCE